MRKLIVILVAVAIIQLAHPIYAVSDSAASAVTPGEAALIAKQAINPDAIPAVEIAPDVWQVLKPKQAFELYQRAATGKNANAIALLGMSYEKGFGVESDPAKGIALIRQSAELNSIAGMYALSVSLSQGPGGAQGEADKWLNKAAGAGYPKAITEQGVRQFKAGDPVEAAKYFTRAALAGDPDAYDFLGQLSMAGQGMPRSADDAFRNFTKSSDAGSARGTYDLGMAYLQGVGVQPDDAKAYTAFRKAADAGFPMAMLNVGALLEEGKGVAKNEAEAAIWYQKAAAAGVALGNENLAQLYEDGRGVPKDHAKATALMRDAAKAGDTSASQWLVDHHESP